MRSISRDARWVTALSVIALLTSMPANAGIWGTPKFTMSQSDDRFSADGLTTYSSDGNRISKKSITGGVHIDKKGVFLNPIARVNRTTRAVELLTFDLFNITDRFIGIDNPNGFGQPLRVSFITGEGTPIVLDVFHGQQRFGTVQCTPGTSICQSSVIEGGVVPLTVDQYRRLIAATALAIKIDGTERSHVFETRDIAPTFIANLTTFYNAHMAGAQ